MKSGFCLRMRIFLYAFSNKSSQDKNVQSTKDLFLNHNVCMFVYMVKRHHAIVKV